MKVYFGRPVNVFGTNLDALLIKKIMDAFPSATIIDPNQPEHAEGYQRFKNETGNGMNYYTKEVLPSCHAGIFLGFRDGMYGAEVYKKAEFFAIKGLPLFEISPTGAISSPDFSLVRALSVEETRRRIRNENGEMIPY